MSTRLVHYTVAPLLFASVLLFPAGACALSQAAARDTTSSDATGPAFEVATIRPANRDDGRRWFGTEVDASGRFQASAVDLSGLVWMAYFAAPNRVKVTTSPVAPKWVSSEAFDIQGKVDEAYMTGWDKLSDEQRREVIRPMVRRLLADRFRMKLGVETRMTPVYALVQAKGGAHVKEVPSPALVTGDTTEAQTRWAADNPGKVFPGSIECSGDKCTGHAVKITDAIGQIAANSRADRMVIDETGMAGYYDLSFPFPSEKEELPMQVVGDELGMRFVPRSVPIKTFVIESAEKPTVDGTEGR